MALKLGPLTLPWPGKAAKDDPYWDFFVNAPASDKANLATEIIRRTGEGAIFPTKTELHTPEITSSHVKELARYLGTDLVGIVRLARPNPDDAEALPFGVVNVVRAAHNPRTTAGLAGQVPIQNGIFVTFVLSAWIRELGYRGTVVDDPEADKLAAAAGLGRLNQSGRLVTRKFGPRVHVAGIIQTDLPLVPDGEVPR